MSFGVVVLAAGRSTRMGSPKLLLSLAGRTLLARAVDTALASGADEVVVVLGEQAERLAREIEVTPLPDPPPQGGRGSEQRLRVVVNPDYAAGQSTSFRAGLQALSADLVGAVVYPADQPFVTPDTIRRLVQAHERSGAPVLVAEAGGIRGAPSFFHRDVIPQVKAVEGDRGARDFIQQHPELVETVVFADEDLMLDVDTPEDYQEVLRRVESAAAEKSKQ